MPRVRTLLLGALGALVVVLAGAAVAYAVGGRPDDGVVAEGVSLGGADVGGLGEDELRQVVAARAASWATTPVVLDDGANEVGTTAAELGSSLDEDATVAAVLHEGRGGWFGGRALRWAAGLVGGGGSDVDPSLRLDRPRLDEAVARLDPGPRQPPLEPRLVVRDDAFAAEPGQPGAGLSGDDVAAALEAATGREAELRVGMTRREVAPTVALAAVEALVPEAEALVERPLPVAAGEGDGRLEAAVPTSTLRTWVVSEIEDGVPVLALDDERVLADLQAAVPFDRPPVDARFDVQGGRPVLVAGATGLRCCDVRTPDVVLRALQARSEGPGDAGAVELPLVETAPARTTELLQGLGVVEEVSAFTTNYQAGQPRVRNIQRIADLVRGQLILPGEVLSINGLVGPRTPEKGFVAAPAIVNARLAAEVGGGISQYMTTLFNAAWFAGLDFDEYQAHTIYISRYPYGREATINFPHPDLAIRNTTPYGVLVWSTYTDTSITVSMYSTKHVDVAQTGQRTGRSGSCTVVYTDRTRTYRDGRPPEVDTFTATYQAAEGFRCTDQYPPPAPTTTAPPPTAAPAPTAPPPAAATAPPPPAAAPAG